MENTLLDRQILEQFADALLAQKYPGQPAETLVTERERIITELDDAVGQSIVDSLSSEQLDEYLNLLNTEQEDSSVFENFFKNNQIDLSKTIEEAGKNYALKYLGGANE